eukprot:1140673-Pelagomonas_calceolata.AAC.1
MASEAASSRTSRPSIPRHSTPRQRTIAPPGRPCQASDGHGRCGKCQRRLSKPHTTTTTAPPVRPRQASQSKQHHAMPRHVTSDHHSASSQALSSTSALRAPAAQLSLPTPPVPQGICWNNAEKISMAPAQG